MVKWNVRKKQSVDAHKDHAYYFEYKKPAKVADDKWPTRSVLVRGVHFQ
jgi:hypothetical protein